MMDCNQFRELLADLDRSGVLPADARESAFAHAEGCADCGQLLTETELLDAGLRRLAAREGDLQAPPRVEARLLNALRQRNKEAVRERNWRYAAAIGIAAAFLLVIGVWLNQKTSDHRRLAGTKVTEPLVAVGSAPHGGDASLVIHDGSAAHADATETRIDRTVARARVRKAANADAPVMDADSTAGFIPLPDADPGPVDDGAVVRVEMPRAALATFGLPVEAMEGNGTVRADLIVSADGTPEAIRLLSQNGTAAAQP